MLIKRVDVMKLFSVSVLLLAIRDLLCRLCLRLYDISVLEGNALFSTLYCIVLVKTVYRRHPL